MTEKPRYIRQAIVVRKDLSMPCGKLGAMCAHASRTFLLRAIIDRYKGYDECEHLSEHFEGGLLGAQWQWMTEIEPGLEYCNQLSFATIVLAVADEAELLKVMAEARAAALECHQVVDGGHSHNKPNTLVCAAIGPDTAERLEPVTGHLKIYR